MPLKVIGAGLGRTGTLSLKVALERLGFDKCYHMTEVIAHPDHVPVWEAAGRGEPVDWEALFRGYRATVDWPGCNFYREFLARYPDAKVILTVRDPERWYDSAGRPSTPCGPPSRAGDTSRMRRLLTMTERLIWDGVFGGRFEDKTHAIEVFHRHNEEVKQRRPARAAAGLRGQGGLGSAVRFLGVPVPEGEPFPHVNDAEEFRSRIRRMSRMVQTVTYSALGLAALVIAGLAIWLMR